MTESLENYPISEDKAEQLRSVETLQTLRQKSQKISQSITVKGTPPLLWPAISHTDFLNQKVGMQLTQNHYLPRDYGNTWMHATTKNGGMKVAYEELPYEWVAPEKYTVERVHKKGPLRYLRFTVELEALNTKETTLTCSIDFVSVLPKAIVSMLTKTEINKFIQAFKDLAFKIEAGKKGVEAFFSHSDNLKSDIISLADQWKDIEPEEHLRKALANFILRAPERLAYRVRPIELSHTYGLDPLEMTQFCLRLTRENILRLKWDCRCPGCKGPKASYSDLAQLSNSTYCETCAALYDVAFDKNLELTFTPNQDLRPTQELVFCAGSPGNTPHIVWQQNFEPTQTREFRLTLPEGNYLLRSLSCEGHLPFSVNEQGSTDLSIAMNHNLQPSAEAPHNLKKGALLTLNNQNKYEMTVMIEDLNWDAQALTAADVQSIQAFHDLFPEQSLPEGQSIPLTHQVFLFIEIETTQDNANEKKEHQDWIKQTLSEYAGAAIVKDRYIQGIFANAFDALSAAWILEAERQELNTWLSSPLHLSMGLAGGPCQVSSKEEHLLYQGEGVKKAEAGLRESNKQGIVIEERLMYPSEMQAFFNFPEAGFQRIQTEETDFVLMQKESV